MSKNSNSSMSNCKNANKNSNSNCKNDAKNIIETAGKSSAELTKTKSRAGMTAHDKSEISAEEFNRK